MFEDEMKISITPEQTKRIKATIEHEVAEFIRALPDLIKSRLENSVAECLGFENRYGVWTVDNCNGRKSTAGGFISSEANKVAKTLMATIGHDWKFSEEQVQAAKKEFAGRVNTCIRRDLWKVAADKADEVLKQLFSNIKISLDKLELKEPTVEEMSNPSYGSNPIEEIFLEKKLNR